MKVDIKTGHTKTLALTYVVLEKNIALKILLSKARKEIKDINL